MRNILNESRVRSESSTSYIFGLSLIILISIFLNFGIAQRAMGNGCGDGSNDLVRCYSAPNSCACGFSLTTNPSGECAAACCSSVDPETCGMTGCNCESLPGKDKYKITGCNCTENYKIDSGPIDNIGCGDSSYPGENGFEIKNFKWKDDDGEELIGFDWTSSMYKVYSVVVAGGGEVNIYRYSNGSIGSDGLVSPYNDDKYKGISHITFCHGSTATGGSITVEKETATQPSEDTDFEFTMTNQSDFTLTVSDYEKTSDKTFINLEAGTYTVQEKDPPDLWYLNEILLNGSSINNDNSVDVDLDSGESVIVTFVNKRLEIEISEEEPALEITQTEEGSGKFSLRCDEKCESKGTFSSKIKLEVEGGNGEYRIGATYDSVLAEDSDDLLELVDSNGTSYSLVHYNDTDTDRPTYNNTNVAQLGALGGDEESFQLKIDLTELQGSYTNNNELAFDLSFWLYPPE